MTSEALTSELNTGTHYTGSGSKRSKDAGPKSCVRLGQFWWWTSRAMMYRGDSDDWMSRCGARPCYHRWTISTSKVFPVVARQKSCCAWPEALNRTVISWIGWQHNQAYNTRTCLAGFILTLASFFSRKSRYCSVKPFYKPLLK